MGKCTDLPTHRELNAAVGILSVVVTKHPSRSNIREIAVVVFVCSFLFCSQSSHSSWQ